jgi:glycosyltransferase involved in cell wall biosynthesis
VQDNTKFERPVSDEHRNAKKHEIGITTPRVILFVGRLTKGKGILVLLEAFQSLNTSDVSLLLIGRGPLEEKLQTKISSLDRVFHISHIPNEELYLYYGISDILVLPSITSRSFKEPWGFVVNEAMCQGCAIVTSDAVGAGIGGLVEHGRNGYIVPENDTHALTAALEKILADDELLDQMKAASLQIIREWTYTKMAKGFAEALEISNGEMSDIQRHVGVRAK